MSAKNEKEILPVPGRTRIDGRLTPTALLTYSPIRLTIIPVDRAQPPLYISRSPQHNFYTFLGNLCSMGTMELKSVGKGTSEETNRRYYTALLKQTLENVIIEKEACESLEIIIEATCFEGSLRDHILVLQYMRLINVEDQRLKQDIEALGSLAKSFTPMAVGDRQRLERELSEKADLQFKEIIKEHGSEIFYTELGVLLMRLRGMDLTVPEQRIEAIKMFRPFELMYKQIGFKDDDLDEIWQSLHHAETGDSRRFLELIEEFWEGIEADEDESEEGPHLAGRERLKRTTEEYKQHKSPFS